MGEGIKLLLFRRILLILLGPNIGTLIIRIGALGYIVPQEPPQIVSFKELLRPLKPNYRSLIDPFLRALLEEPPPPPIVVSRQIPVVGA